jgi:hypothetical protein
MPEQSTMKGEETKKHQCRSNPQRARSRDVVPKSAQNPSETGAAARNLKLQGEGKVEAGGGA